MEQLEYLMHNGAWGVRAGESLSYPGFMNNKLSLSMAFARKKGVFFQSQLSFYSHD